MTGAIHFNQFTPPVRHDLMTNTETLSAAPAITPEVEYLAAEALTRIALDADGQPIADGSAEAWEAAQQVEPEVVFFGQVRFKIVGDGVALAKKLDAIDPAHSDATAFIVELHPDEEDGALAMGSYVLLTTEGGVSIPYLIWISRADLDEPAPDGFDLGPQAERNADLEVLGARQALVVQVLEE